MERLLTGKYGEQIAARFLEKQQYKILYCNYRFRHAEVDIICEKDNQLIIVEVKSRKNDYVQFPWEAVTPSKQKQMIKVAQHYIENNDSDSETRFDIVSITFGAARPHIEHIQDAFSPTLS